MSATVPALRLLFALTLVFLAPVTGARAEHADRLDIEAVPALVRLDGQLRPVAALGAGGAAQLDADGAVQLRVVDLANEILPATAVDFILGRDQRLRLEVLDLEGNLVRTLAEGLWAAGRHQLAWQHDADSGDRLEQGHYVVRLVPEAAGELVALTR